MVRPRSVVSALLVWPPARSPDTNDPMEVPPTMSIGTPASSSARIAPKWLQPRAPPPPSTSPTDVPVIQRA